ncbi:hypothetical protein K2173_005860 [Erythroxylum novogranatense]|uniref:Sucrose transporter n=1 Tax=Erythroxylum novogranatense TaxID=1862640 RepID=A0AAV8U5Z5_9ROSI|nr:hypothetical protein K2173_005860 [Erythroxylum novogranatense]
MEIESRNETEQSPSIPFRKIVSVASIAAGVQFGWALQLSLLTPYVQLIGIPHKLASLIWLCGPVSGLLVQPTVGYYSDRCTSRFGRRRPFIAAGAVSVAIAVFFIGYASDIGHHSGDSLTKKVKPRAIAIFVVGFWILDVANNMLQGPCRAFMADLSGNDHRKMRKANACFSFFMAVGNVLGYSAGAYNKMHKLFPFTSTTACDVYCSNLKSCFFISVILLLVLTALALIYVREEPWKSNDSGKAQCGDPGNDRYESSESAPSAFCGEIFSAFKSIKRPMLILLLVTCFNWIAWFPFLLYDTDWMGREVYGGDSRGDPEQVKLYDRGVHSGAFGLMVNSVVLGFMSLGVEVLGRSVGGLNKLWGIVNLILSVCLAMTVLISKLAASSRRNAADGTGSLPLPPKGIRNGALALFAVLGIPQAITFSVPFALASIFSNTSGAGQGLSLGVLNLSIVVPQMVVSFASGPWDALFGGGNLPAFVVGAIAAAISAILAITMLPSPSQLPMSTTTSRPTLRASH